MPSKLGLDDGEKGNETGTEESVAHIARFNPCRVACPHCWARSSRFSGAAILYDGQAGSPDTGPKDISPNRRTYTSRTSGLVRQVGPPDPGTLISLP